MSQPQPRGKPVAALTSAARIDRERIRRFVALAAGIRQSFEQSGGGKAPLRLAHILLDELQRLRRRAEVRP
jgi:hypothetical protein